MEHKEYGTFICLSEKGKEELRNMSDAQLEFLASIIYENILETQFELMGEHDLSLEKINDLRPQE